MALTNAAGNHAVLVREGDSPRALLASDSQAHPRPRLLVLRLGDDVALRSDADAAAEWLTQGSVGPGTEGERLPVWASVIGFATLILMLGLLLIGSATVFGWLLVLLRLGR